LGCGTTKWSDTSRTATEQLLISDAADRAISQIDFKALAGKEIYLDTRYMSGSMDEKYLMSTLRQHMLATGCVIREKPEEARYIVEVRAGAVGTNRNDLLLGIPSTSLPTGGMFPMAPTTIPEIPLMKRTNQQGVCKVAVFAYERASGRPVWQSGTHQFASKAKDLWVLGTGPFQRGTIYQGTKFAGERLEVPLAKLDEPAKPNEAWVSQEILFSQPPRSVLPPQFVQTSPPAVLQAGPQPFPAFAAPSDPQRRGPPPRENQRAGYFEPVAPAAREPQPLAGPRAAWPFAFDNSDRR
jgi:hypothetical protein